MSTPSGCQAGFMKDADAAEWKPYAVVFGLVVARVRIERGLSQREAAAAAGISDFTWQKLEQGLSNPRSRDRREGPANPTLRTLAQIAQSLGVDIADLIPPDAPDVTPGRPSAA
jgi:transcriptional regulator with XRE-family HTH domain